MELVEHARMELEMAGLLSEDNDFYGGMTGNAVLELIQTFANQGHSGMSASVVADLFKKLANYETLGPITGKDDEWNILDDYDLAYAQNKRLSSLFKDHNGKVTYIYAIIKRDESGTTWTGGSWLSMEDYLTGDRSKMIRSTQEIKKFPFKPKKFYVDIKDVEVAPGNFESFIKNPKQLDNIWKYYKKPF